MPEVEQGLRSELSRRQFLYGAAALTGALVLNAHLAPGEPYAPADNGHLLLADGRDPWVTEHEGTFYYAEANWTGSEIRLRSSKALMGLAETANQTVWEAERAGLQQIWAPELHYDEEESAWAYYFSAQNSHDDSRRMYSLAAEEPGAEPTFMGQLTPEPDHWAIDGTLWEYNGQRHMIWSGWPGTHNGRQDLYLARMSSPWQVDGHRFLIAQPQHYWEKRTSRQTRGGIIEAPQVVPHTTRNLISYSASASWSDNYCVGFKEFIGVDPMNDGVDAWLGTSNPVFASANGVYGPGHAAFVRDETGLFKMIHHNAKHRGAGHNRHIRWQDWTYDPDGTPNFGQPL